MGDAGFGICHNAYFAVPQITVHDNYDLVFCSADAVCAAAVSYTLKQYFSYIARGLFAIAKYLRVVKEHPMLDV